MSLFRSGLLPAILLLMISIEVFATTAVPPKKIESCAMAYNDTNPNGEEAPTFSLTIKYPDGRRKTYTGSSIPSRVEVLTGDEVILQMGANVKNPGDYTVLAQAASDVDIPSNARIFLGASSSCRGNVGYIAASAGVTFPDYFDGASATLEIYTTWQDNVKHTREEWRRVVEVELIKISTNIVNPRPTFTNLPGSTNTSTTSTTTSTSTTETSSSSSEEVHWITSTTQTGSLQISPDSQEVKAGETAVFTINTTLNSPTFKLLDMPVGLRYTVTGGNGTYLLRLKTSPLFRGTYSMRIEATSGNVVESGSILLKVLKESNTEETQMSTSSSPSSSSSTTITSNTGSTQTSQKETKGQILSSTTSSPIKSSQIRSTTKSTGEERMKSLVLTAMGFTVIILLLIILLMLRKR